MKAIQAFFGFLAIFLAISSAVAQAGFADSEHLLAYADDDYEDSSDESMLAKRTKPGVQNTINDWKGKCQAKKPAIANAISRFCTQAGPSNHVPRVWTLQGVNSDNTKFDPGAHISIAGSCYPQQWVPTKFCFIQFYKMCVQDTAASGGGAKSFGKGGCQLWAIDRYQQTGSFSKMAGNIASILG